MTHPTLAIQLNVVIESPTNPEEKTGEDVDYVGIGAKENVSEVMAVNLHMLEFAIFKSNVELLVASSIITRNNNLF